MIEDKISIPADSTVDVFSEDIRGAKQIKITALANTGVWGTATLYGGYGGVYTDHKIESKQFFRDYPIVFPVDPGYHYLKLKIYNACYTSPMEVDWKLELTP